MAAIGDAVADYLATAGTITQVATYSYCFWYNPTTAAGTATQRMILSLASAGTYEFGFIWSDTNANFYRSAYHFSGAGTYAIAQLASSPATATWHHITVTYDGTTLKVYVNGSLAASTLSGPPVGTTNPNVWVQAYGYGGVASRWNDGSVAQVCIWNVGLTAAEAFTLYTGTSPTSPTSVRTASIVFYDPLDTAVPGSGALGPALTAFSAIVMNVSHFAAPSGGIAIGDGGIATAINHAYTFTMSGGIAIGDGGIFAGITTKHVFTVSGGIAIGGSYTQVVQGFTNGARTLITGRAVGHTHK